ncbi:hypothetical protein HGRIS_001809 [Hohenbuehelia grisea]|uniref:Peptide hydrolase n=1 Tax=Hohenbuehelia grisea TaxID=104357 RepID=A0ABR3JIY4_9AGAR
MTISKLISSSFAFRLIPTTLLAILVYVVIFVSVLVTDQVPSISKDQHGLDLSQAYSDLREITNKPHPYNSHSNDQVHRHILSRVQGIAQTHPDVHVVNDLLSNGSWSSRGYGVYFEGTNILVKIDGSEAAESNGVLFSAHYDSVSTASGTTDDGMGVVTLIQLVDYFARNQPKRTVVFNINNGEEDWLNGAHAFLKHPWSALVDTFLNLEGAASGGRPILFRATSSSPLRAFSSSHVPHPHANVISADAFARGVIRSGTDYSVYTEGADMQGLDLAFYKGRSRYHTKYDAIPFTDGGKRSLWSMMEAALGAGLALANDDSTHTPDADAPVYFDLFGSALILFSLPTLITANIVILVLGIVFLILLAACAHIILLETQRRAQAQNGNAPHAPDQRSALRHLWDRLISLGWLPGLWRRAKFWVALTASLALQVGFVALIVYLNPLIVYSSPYVVLLSSLSLAYLSLSVIMNIPVKLSPYPARSRFSLGRFALIPEQQKYTTLMQTYLLTWLLLIAATITSKNSGIGGLYAVTAWNIVAWTGCALACMEEMVGARGTKVWEAQGHGALVGGRRMVRGVRYDAPQGQASEDEAETPDGEEAHGGEVETAPTEITPLIAQQRRASYSAKLEGEAQDPEDHGAIGWWIAQMLVVVPLPVILVSHIGVILVGALPQTLADGSSAVVVYAALSFVSLLLVLPLAPFMIKMHRLVSVIMLALFAATLLYSSVVFPFSQDAPLKVFFQQFVHVDLGLANTTHLHLPDAHAEPLSVTTALTGLKDYLPGIIAELPSADGKIIDCAPDPARVGLTTCKWPSDLTPSPGFASIGESDPHRGHGQPHRKRAWLNASVVRLNATAAQVKLRGTNTRSCRVYLDTRAIEAYEVEGGAGGMQHGYGVGEEGLREVRLWSRTWDREFVVDVVWKDEGRTDVDNAQGMLGANEVPSGEFKGRVACEWAEYESGSTGNSAAARIPAYEEVLTFLPKWAVASKSNDGLVEVWAEFSL